MTDHVVTFDASCSCGEHLIGAWSASEVEAWAEDHEDQPADPEDGAR